MFCSDLTAPVSDFVESSSFPTAPTKPYCQEAGDGGDRASPGAEGLCCQRPEFQFQIPPTRISFAVWIGGVVPASCRTQLSHLYSGLAVLKPRTPRGPSPACPAPPLTPAPRTGRPGRTRAAAPTAKPSPAASRDLDATSNPRTGPLI